jgi:hypothetical protein
MGTDMFYAYNESGRDTGPYTADQLRAKLASGEFTDTKLIRPQTSKDGWQPLHVVLGIPRVPKGGNPASSAAVVSPDESPPWPSVAIALTVFAWIELIASPLAALALGVRGDSTAVPVLFVGLLGASLLFGFSAVVVYVHQCAERLRRIERSLKERKSG